MKRQIIVVIAALALVAPGALMAQGDLTLEDLATQVKDLTSKVVELFTTQDDLAQRLAAVETAIAPTVTPTATPTMTPTPTHTATVVPSPTPIPAEPIVTLQRRMNVRRGPGTNHVVLGTADAGEEFRITGRNLAGDWWQIDFRGREAWVYAPYVTDANAADVKVVATPTALPSPTPMPTPIPTATLTPESIPEEELDLLAYALALILWDLEAIGAEDEWYTKNTVDQNLHLAVISGLLDEVSSYCDLPFDEMAFIVDEHGSTLDVVGYTIRNDVRARGVLLLLLSNYSEDNPVRPSSCDALLTYMALALIGNEE